MGIIACVIIGGITGWIIDNQTRVSQIGHVLSITIGVLGATFGWQALAGNGSRGFRLSNAGFYTHD